ncbi:hypothetical protein RJ639_012172 [Escallonia herrerae]|uniref:Tryptophan synthase n=1 Tax=Escallonia herrerae TaxID=1293975 RepID=A0AA88VN51_9ASTE|nr:hypothetical protein RJ639_012172 [Escallonia herrerae]
MWTAERSGTSGHRLSPVATHLRLLVACVGGGSNAMGIFHEFVDDKDVRLIGVEAAGFGLDSGKHAATLTK